MKKKVRRKRKIQGTSERPRLVVFRSLKHIYGQLVIDTSRKSILGASSLSNEITAEIKKAKTRVEEAKIVGQFIAKKAIDKKVRRVIFDRNGYTYHGRVKALADGAREGGLDF
jgi:large subunit ribosomal protein L18